MVYNNLSTYFREKYGRRLKKICIDGGFSCPNRDGKCGTGGCIFCGERGSGEHIDPSVSIGGQVRAALISSRADDKFIAYFQNFTNTYADIETLRKRYDAALIDERIVALAIGTRPDCINKEVAELIASYRSRVFVWVEMGLQTSNDKTAEIINRGYKTEVYTGACEILKKYDIPTVAHMIVGLPGEKKEDALRTAEYIASLGIFGIKIHSIYVMRGTRLSDMYNENLYTPPTLSEYADTVSDIISRLPKNMIIHRLTGDCPKDLLVAPEWNKSKTEIIDAINSSLKVKGLSQGALARDF
jgi:radical SAM protein (TIGR01212 family)